MKGRFWRATLVLLTFIISLILQTTILPLLKIEGVMPDLILVLVVFTALFSSAFTGGVVGFTAGLVQDLIIGRYLGLCAFSGLLVGWLVGELESRFYKENPLVPVILVFIATFVYDLVYYLGRGLCGSFPFSLSYAGRSMLLEAVYNMVLSVVLYKPLLRLFLPAAGDYSDRSSVHFFDVFYR